MLASADRIRVVWYNYCMRSPLAMVGIGAVVLLAGAWFAFNRSFTAVPENDNEVTSSTPSPMAENLSLTSPDFEANGSIPGKFTCDGQQVNPALRISGVPSGAKSLVFLMDDPDIPDVFKKQRGIDAFDHWTLFNIPPSTTEIAQGTTVGTPGVNGAGKNEYMGPCPPREHEPSEHRYFFKLYALASELSLPPGATKAQVHEGMQGHVLAETELIGKYKRP